jgi:hypothetical protein
MRTRKRYVNGQQASNIADHDLATALRQSLELPEVPGKLDETDRSLPANAVRALRSCYADLVRETKAGLHDLYESTVAEIRLAYTGAAGMPDERGEGAAPGRGQVPAAGSDEQNGDPFREHGTLIHPCAPGISIEISTN